MATREDRDQRRKEYHDRLQAEREDLLGYPVASRLGRLRLALSDSFEPAESLDRLVAIKELREILDEAEKWAVTGARMSRCTWAEMGRAWGTTRQGAFNRWGRQVKELEAGGALAWAEPLPDPVEPIIGTPALDDARSWCRWCGHRIVTGGDGWAHNATDGVPGDFIEVECPGPEPWPAWAE